LLTIACSSCATTTFKSYEGGGVTQGTGGTRDVIEGIDFWENGTPPRKFRIIGIIDDERPKGIILDQAFKKDVARKARAAGADGVIMLESSSQITGYIGNAQAFTNPGLGTASVFGTSTPVRQASAKFSAIKYL
jgi:hypothetical protein